MVALFTLGNVMVSCDSCNKKTEADASTVTYTDTIGNGFTATTADTTVVADKNADDNKANSAPSGNAKTNAKSDAKNAKKNGSSVGGYSAPDGTDAENHDGDQYTQNDQKPRPSGPPIK